MRPCLKCVFEGHCRKTDPRCYHERLVNEEDLIKKNDQLHTKFIKALHEIDRLQNLYEHYRVVEFNSKWSVEYYPMDKACGWDHQRIASFHKTIHCPEPEKRARELAATLNKDKNGSM